MHTSTYNTSAREPRPRPGFSALLRRFFGRGKRARTMGDWIMLGIFTLMFGGLGVMLIVVGSREFFSQRRIVATAVPVQATILSSRVATSRSADTDTRLLRDNSTTSHTPEVRFEYRFQDIRYESDLLYPTIIHRGYASAAAAAAEIAEYQPGLSVGAYVSASDPRRGFLRLHTSNAPVWFTVAGCLCFVFLAVLFRFA